MYAVGVGPGDPQLLTLKAVQVIGKCPVIALPASGKEINIAGKIAAEYIKEKEIVECGMPMTTDKEERNRVHDLAAGQIAAILDQGRDVAFLTLGDPSIYSTVMYVLQRVRDRGYETEMVPGITSFCGAAASLGISLCQDDEMLHIIPACYEGTGDSMAGTRVLMKSGKKIVDIKESLRGRHAMAVENATTEEEHVWKDIDDMNEIPGYFTMVVVPGEKEKE